MGVMRIFLSGLAMVAVAAISGCATGEPGSYVPLNTSVNGGEDHALVVVVDSRLQYSVACPAIEERATPDGRLEVTARLRDREDRPLAVKVDCIFKDARGHRVGKDAPAQLMTLNVNVPAAVHFVADSSAARYTVRICSGE
jgi:hypothetical protein